MLKWLFGLKSATVFAFGCVVCTLVLFSFVYAIHLLFCVRLVSIKCDGAWFQVIKSEVFMTSTNHRLPLCCWVVGWVGGCCVGLV